MRTLTLILCLPALVTAQDAADIMRRALAEDAASAAVARNYTYLEHQELRTRDGGKFKVRESNTWDVTLLEGSPYRRLVAHDGQPLTPKSRARKRRSCA